MEALSINIEKACDLIVDFIGQTFKKSGFENAVIGLSGGIDSSTVAYLAQRALGADNVWGISMPYRSSSQHSANDAQIVAKNLGINFETIEITEMVDAYFKNFPDADPLRRGNLMARERMVTLYDQSSLRKALVLGCGNKTEILLGYSTLHGDTACAMLPIGGLYKTQVRALAKHLGVPDQIIHKAPTADLWPGQTDEDELGFTYAEVDELLYFMIEKRFTFEELKEKGFSELFVNEVSEKILRAKYKSCLPPVPQINAMSALECVGR